MTASSPRMGLRNDAHGYGVVTKTLHWLTVLLLVGQLLLGYSLEDWSEWVSETDEGDADQALVFLHGWVGGAILLLGVLRLVWRRATPLPPWSDRLTALDRRIEHRVEQLLYGLLLVMPLSGMALLLLSGVEREVAPDREWQPPYDVLGDDLLLNLHIASHVALYATVAVHVGLALRRGTWRRMV